MSTNLGAQAEQLAADWLGARGLRILERNWRNRYSEIDIVARARKRVHFVEVKYRKSINYGRGLDYITPDKALRLRRAAAAWIAAHEPNANYQIDILTVEGDLAVPHIEYLPNAVVD